MHIPDRLVSKLAVMLFMEQFVNEARYKVEKDTSAVRFKLHRKVFLSTRNGENHNVVRIHNNMYVHTKQICLNDMSTLTS